jgi:hypothetical protein
MNIICRNYEHYNNAMGCYVKSKSDYIEKMKTRGFIDKEEADAIAKKNKEKNTKKYELSEDSKKLISSVKNGFISSRMKDNMPNLRKTDFKGNSGGFK